MATEDVTDPALAGWVYRAAGAVRGPYTISHRRSEGNTRNTVYDVYKEGRPTRLAKALRSLEAAQRAAHRDEHPPPPKEVDLYRPDAVFELSRALDRLSIEVGFVATGKRSERAGQIESVVADVDRLLAPYRK